MKLLSFKWWNEKTIPVAIDGEDDWIAPRWYPLVFYVVLIGIIMLIVNCLIGIMN